MKRLKNQKIAINNPKHEWLEKDYPGFLHAIFMQGLHAGVYELNKLYPFGFKEGYSINSNQREDWFWDARELQRVREIFLSRAKKNLNFFFKIYARWERDHKRSMEAYKRAENLHLEKLTDKQLFDEYENIYHKNVAQGASGYLSDSFLSSGHEDWLVEFIKEQTNISDLATIEILTAGVIPTYSNECAVSLLRIKKKIKAKPKTFREFLKSIKNEPRVWSELQKHTENYFWVENNYFPKHLEAEDFARQLFNLKTNNFADNLAANKKRKAEVLRKFNNPFLSNVIRMSELMTHMQDYRKMGVVRMATFWDRFFNEMARRRKINVVDFQNIVEPELKDVFLGRKIDRTKLRLRAQKNFCYANANGYLVFEDKDLERYVDLSVFQHPASDHAEIRGVPARQGFVIGKVRVIRNISGARIKKGEILVTNNTTPEFVPLMKKAAAIITEQGGITTHAAIVSRELGVPCVIGTKIATKVFKDGDLVEVDANKGIIRKI